MQYLTTPDKSRLIYAESDPREQLVRESDEAQSREKLELSTKRLASELESSILRPLPSFASILRHCQIHESDARKTVTLEYEYFQKLLRSFVSQSPFDKDLYLKRYPGLRTAEEEGLISSCRAHWVFCGYLEGRVLYGWELFDFSIDEILTAPQAFFDALRRGFVSEAHHCFENAETYYLEAVRSYDRSVWGYLALAKFYFRTKQFVKSEEAVRTVLQRDPACGLARELMYDLAIEFRQNERALAFAVAGRAPSMDYVFRLLSAGKVRQAKRLVNTATNCDALFRAFAESQLNAKLGEMSRLLRQYNSLRKRQSLNDDQKAELSLCVARLDHAEKAFELIQDVLRQAKERSFCNLTAAGFGLLIEATRISKGLEAAAKIIDEYSNPSLRDAPLTRKKRFEIAYEMNDLPLAKCLAETDTDLLSDPSIFELYAYALIRSGEVAKAIAACRRCWRLAEDRPSLAAIGLMAFQLDGTINGLSFENPSSSPAELQNHNLFQFSLIPYKIFQFWDRECPPPDVQASMQTWRDNNPDFEYTWFCEASARDFLLENYGTELANLFEFCHHPAMKSDLFRVAYLAKKGGWYVDADEVSLRPLRELVEAYPEKDLFLSYSNKGCYLINGFMAARAQHPIIVNVLSKIVRSLSKAQKAGIKPNIWDATGPGQISCGVAEHLILTKRTDEVTQRMGLLHANTLESFREMKPLIYKQTISGNWRAGAYGLAQTSA